MSTACLVLASGAQPQAQAPPAVHIAIDLAITVGVDSVAAGVNDLGTVVGRRSHYGPDMAYSDMAYIWTAETGVTDLGCGTALAVNNRSVVAGHSWSHGVPDAMVWSHGDAAVIAFGVAYSLNNRGTVVGYHYPPGGVYHAFRWTSLYGLQDLESLTGALPPWSYLGPFSEALSIRDDGVMAGWRGSAAVVWQPSGEVMALGPGVAVSINDNGLAVGATRRRDAP